MKPLRIFLLLAGLLLASSRAEAQFSISKVTPKEADVKNFRDTIKQLSAVNNQFFSEARYRAEKKRLRKERNTITCTVGLSLNQTGFDNWAPGGNNTFDATASLLYTHVYTRDKLNMTYSFDSKYGMNVISGTTFKNLDYFIFNLNTGWAISKNWSYSASANLRSQWSKGYKSVTEKILVSNFMSPGTLTLGVGFTYRALKKVPLIVTVNPLSGNMQFVLDDSLSRQGAHGVPARQAPEKLARIDAAHRPEPADRGRKDELHHLLLCLDELRAKQLRRMAKYVQHHRSQDIQHRAFLPHGLQRASGDASEPLASMDLQNRGRIVLYVQKQVASGTGIAHGPDKKLSLKRHVQKQ